MPPGQLDLFLDQVEIIEQPFGRGGDAPGLVHRQGRAVEGPDNLLVFIQSGQQPVGPPARADL